MKKKEMDGCEDTAGNVESVFKWHALDEGRGYLSVHLGEGATFKVLTTPITDEPEEAHRVVMWEKIERKKDAN